jgi:hypothetical protein
MSIETQLFSEIKPFINIGNLEGLKELWSRYQNETDFGRVIAWDSVFQKVYLHAALKKQHSICAWLDELYLEFDPIRQIAMRQMFSYAKYLLNKR